MQINRNSAVHRSNLHVHIFEYKGYYCIGLTEYSKYRFERMLRASKPDYYIEHLGIRTYVTYGEMIADVDEVELAKDVIHEYKTNGTCGIYRLAGSDDKGEYCWGNAPYCKVWYVS